MFACGESFFGYIAIIAYDATQIYKNRCLASTVYYCVRASKFGRHHTPCQIVGNAMIRIRGFRYRGLGFGANGHMGTPFIAILGQTLVF